MPLRSTSAGATARAWMNGGSPLVERLLVGGGGGGGGSNNAADGGGGGAGRMVEWSASLAPGSYLVVVGDGGNGGGTTSGGQVGNASTFDGQTAPGGGGGGGGGNGGGSDGGSGGGSGKTDIPDPGDDVPGTPLPGLGNPANFQQGGGATNSTGTGKSSDITGSAVTYAAGGDPGNNNVPTANTGNGGNGGIQGAPAGTPPAFGTKGAAGVGIFKYRGAPRGTGGVITQVGGFTIHKFNSTGYFNYMV